MSLEAKQSPAQAVSSNTSDPQSISPCPSERREAFLLRLAQMSPEERLRAARSKFGPRQRSVWASSYPDEVPTVNGEVEWIAQRLSDLD